MLTILNVCFISPEKLVIIACNTSPISQPRNIMLKRLMLRQTKVVGVNITSNNIYAVELGHYNKKFSALNYQQFNYVSNNNEEDLNCIQQLKHLFSNKNFSTNKIAIAVSADETFTKVITVKSHLTQKELQKLVIYNLENHFSIDYNEYHFSYKIINSSDLEKLVLIFAVPLKIIKIYVGITNKANLNLRVIDVTLLAIKRLLYFSVDKEHRKKTLLLIVFSIKSINFLWQKDNKIIYLFNPYCLKSPILDLTSIENLTFIVTIVKNLVQTKTQLIPDKIYSCGDNANIYKLKILIDEHLKAKSEALDLKSNFNFDKEYIQLDENDFANQITLGLALRNFNCLN